MQIKAPRTFVAKSHPRFRARILDVPAGAYRRIVDKHVDPTVTPNGPGYERATVGLLADVRPLENGPAAFLSDTCGNSCSVRLVSV
jgi:hypothetical protein